ncbi:MAG: hypothetical protein HY291_10895 [Planctomycetes bacterium]|nr:hypothetical protein [Planctomycetota bacterium]
MPENTSDSQAPTQMDLPKPPAQNWFSKPEPKKRRRGPWFGALVVLSILLLVPLLVFLGFYIYVKLGYLDRAVKGAMEDALGPGASVGKVSVEGFDALSAENLSIPPASGFKAPVLHADALKIEWSPWSALLDKRIRGVTVEKPVIQILRSERNAWNLQFQQAAKPSEYKLEQALFHDGTLKLQWAPGRGVAFEGVDITLSRPDPPLPAPVTLKAKLPSGAEVRGDFLLGPGPARRGSLRLAVALDKDLTDALPPASGIAGQLTLRLDSQLEAAEDGQKPGKGTFNATLGLNSFRWKLSDGLALECARQEFGLQGSTQGDLAALPPIEDLRIHAEGLGQASGNLELVLKSETAGAPFIRIQKASARANLDALRGLFAPRLFGVDLATDGEAVLENAEAVLPLSADIQALKLAADLRAEGVRVGFPGLGRLPPLDVKGRAELTARSAKISGATFKLGEVGQATLSADAAWQTERLELLEILRQGKLENIQFDLARLFETDLGRRLAGQQFDLSRPAPALGELPVLAKGTVAARDLKVTAAEAGGATTLTLEGIALRGFELLRWPLPIPLPANGFNGELKAVARFEQGQLRTAALSAALSEAADPQFAGRVSLSADPGPDGKLAVRKVKLDALLIPMAELARFAGLKDGYGLQWKGHVRIANGEYDLASGDLACDLELNSLAVDFQVAGANVEKLSNVIGKARLNLKGGKLTVAGAIESADLSGLKTFKFQPLDFTSTATLGAGPLPRDAALTLKWRDGVECSVTAEPQAKGQEQYRVTGKVSTNMAGGLNFAYDALIDCARREIASLLLNVPELDLVKARKELLAPFLPPGLKLAGGVKDARLELRQVKFASLAGPLDALRPLEGSLSGSLRNGSFEHEVSRCEADDLEGTFRVNFSLDEAGAAMLDLGARFTKYQILVGGPVIQGLYGKTVYDLLGGQFYIPGLPERALQAQVAVRSARTANAATVKVDKLLFDLENLARVELNGSMQAPLDGDFLYKGEGLMTQRLSVYDLAAAMRELGVANLRLRHPMLAQAKVSGACSLEAKNQWSGEQSAILATLNLNRVGLSIGAERKLQVANLDGPLPLTFFRGLWPADWPREQRGTLTLSSAALPPLSVRQQPIAVSATPNAVALANPISVSVPGGEMVLENLRLTDFLALEPAVRFDLNVKGISLDLLAKAEGWGIGGLGDTVLSGKLVNSALVRTSGPLGSWTLATEGELRAPFYQGALRAGGFRARGLFGAAPVWGAWLKIEHMSMLQFMGQNKQLGRLKAIADLSITDFTATGFGLDDVQSFVFDLDTQHRPEVEDEYDGRLALLLARPMVEDAMRKYGKSEADIMAMKFALKRIGLRFVLDAGTLRGPQPKLPENKIIEGRNAYSPDVPGDAGASMPWREAVQRLRGHMSLLSKTPE